MKDLDPVTALLWTEPIPPKRGPRPTLTLPMIAAAGIALADEGGLDVVTMEAVAQRLGLTKMALYRYLPGKAELVALMVEAAIGAPPTAARAKTWRRGLTAWARALFAKFSEHPWALEATLGARPSGPNAVAWWGSARAALADSGRRGADKLDVVVTLTGHVRHLVEQVPVGDAEITERSLLSALRALMAGRDAQFPALAAVLRERTPRGGEGAAFEFGLERILDGVEVLIESQPRRPKRS